MDSFIDDKYLVKQIIYTGSIEPKYCITFGCGKKLTITEQLAGNKCISCMQVKDRVFKHYKF